jgi:hypothetical protein
LLDYRSGRVSRPRSGTARVDCDVQWRAMRHGIDGIVGIPGNVEFVSC